MSILITGGAGFIGSHTAKLLSDAGAELIILDNLSTGRRSNVRWGHWIEGDVGDYNLVRSILRDHAVEAVLHLAARAHVGESMQQPHLYFQNNVVASVHLLSAMMAEDVRQLVFASSSSVYGNSRSDALEEYLPPTPVSPYGESKLQTERMLPWYAQAYGLRWAALRYFNVAGAEGTLGEDIATSSRIIPRAVRAAVADGPAVQVFGTDLPTRDGSAVRDYVHVCDVARANRCALKWLAKGNSGEVINIGSGTGTSVLQILNLVHQQAGSEVRHSLGPSRPGDPPQAVSNISVARNLLGWSPTDSGITEIVSSVVTSSLPVNNS